MKELDDLAEKLNLSKDEMLRESLKFFLERKLTEIKTKIFSNSSPHCNRHLVISNMTTTVHDYIAGKTNFLKLK